MRGSDGNKQNKGVMPAKAGIPFGFGLEKGKNALELLKWYNRHRRVLPWRAAAGEKADPYHVWLSEIMLQQTTVAAVGPYFMKFVKRWPTVRSLAAASQDEIYQMWAGLGYYRRAKNLHLCAKELAKNGFPKTEKGLLNLPGIGPYTAAAIAAIAFDQRANVVDGNVERVVARLFNIRQALPQAKKKIRALAETLLPESRFGDYAQALMDLGATVCVPGKPKCGLCPWADVCAARAKGTAESLPRRAAKKAKPVRRGVAFVARDAKGAVFLRQRPETGLLAGMMEVPSTPWEEKPMPAWPKARAAAPFKASWRLLSGPVHHTFTHFDLELSVAVAKLSGRRPKGLWVRPEDWGDQALPSVMRKVLRRALKEEIKDA